MLVLANNANNLEYLCSLSFNHCSGSTELATLSPIYNNCSSSEVLSTTCFESESAL